MQTDHESLIDQRLHELRENGQMNALRYWRHKLRRFERRRHGGRELLWQYRERKGVPYAD